MLTRRQGFTLLEMLLVVVIGSVILLMGTRQYSGISNRRAVVNAANAMVLTANRARSEAMRSGRLIYLEVDPTVGEARVETAFGDVVHSMEMSTYGGSMVGTPFTVCYAARGYALPGCSSAGNHGVVFVRGVDTAAVRMTALGHARRIQ